MWSYFGAKTSVVKYYPVPKEDKIIESHAGTARYALYHFEHDILLVDKYEVIVRLWQWLQKCSEGDIKRLPHKIEAGQSLNDFTFDCIEEKWLMGFLIGMGMASPRITASSHKTTHRPNHINYSLNRIAKNLFKIRHWKIELGSYEDIPNQKATWFIDPPYQHGGEHYVKSNKDIDFAALGEWCRSREGQVIVCETAEATWLDFKPMRTHRTVRRKSQQEAIWCNQPTEYDYQQQRMFV